MTSKQSEYNKKSKAKRKMVKFHTDIPEALSEICKSSGFTYQSIIEAGIKELLKNANNQSRRDIQE
jgi:regulator of PEP synthase PpsR (kinase-PPPase family)